MTKKLFLITLTVLLATSAFGQDVKKEAQKEKTKMEAFVSKTGVIVKYIDYNLPSLRLRYGTTENRIRKVVSGGITKYFYQIEKDGKYSNSTASIEYSDLKEVIKAIKSLETDLSGDVQLNPDYLENKFTTSDGFQVGYYVSKGKAQWYLKLERYGSNTTIFPRDEQVVVDAFNKAKEKIDELKK